MTSAADRQALRDLVARLNMHGDHGRFDALAACFTPAGRLRWHTGEGMGRQGIVAAIIAGASNPAVTLVRHHLTTMDFDVADGGTEAMGRICFLVITNAGPDHAGIYLDRYRRTAEGWRIDDREIRILWQATTSFYAPQVTDG